MKNNTMAILFAADAESHNLPFASISLFGNYYSYPSKNWNFGINFGILMYNPKFIE